MKGLFYGQGAQYSADSDSAKDADDSNLTSTKSGSCCEESLLSSSNQSSHVRSSSAGKSSIRTKKSSICHLSSNQ